ncbi:CBS domain-containing protein [Streptomyces sp. NPDC006624]|uniref:CBS domain-containing protein n=1 Tax=unclassified Streptomyces TaxID=2593676 RepID=UPI00339E0BD5
MKPTQIGALMARDVVTAEYGTPFKEVVRLLGEHRISGLPVVDEDDKVIGVVSETDLMLRQAAGPGGETWLTRLRRRRHSPESRFASRALPRAWRDPAGSTPVAGGLMSAPAVTVRADATVTEAARLMAGHRIERLPVVDEEDRLIGIVTRHDLLKVFLGTDEEIRRAVGREVLLDTLGVAPRTVAVQVRDGVVTLSGVLERRTEKSIALALTGRVDGVVGVVDELAYRIDDTRLEPVEQTLHGVADDWLRKL